MQRILNMYTVDPIAVVRRTQFQQGSYHWKAGADPGFQVRGGGIFGVFLVKNRDFMPKKSCFFQFQGPPGKGVFLKIKSGTVVPSEFEPPFPLHIFHRHVNNTHSYIRDTGTTSMHIQLQASHLYLKSKISTYRSMLHLIM